MVKTTEVLSFKISQHIELCYGCRTCELACSFHHVGVFSTKHSSIRISKSNRTGVINWDLSSSCDDCEKEERPLCVKYCSYGALELGGQR